jgi:L-2-hydroxyglutarate oxidase LhgO
MTDIVECGPVVIGAGALGLAIAAELSKIHDSVVVLDTEAGFGYHTSSRNSEVIHSGIYYTPGSLKSQLCLDGKELMYQYLKEKGVPHKQSGKLIVAQHSENELSSLDALKKNADEIGLGYRSIRWNSSDIQNNIPLKPCEGIFIPDTGYFDSHLLMRALEQDITANQGVLSYNSRVTAIDAAGSRWEISVNDNDFVINTDCIINAAGLFADRIAALSGIYKYKLYFYKGEYYKTNKIRDLKHLVYAVPPADQLSLGIHTRNYMDGSIGFGPNAYPVKNVDYSIDESRKAEFLTDINKYLDVDLAPEDIYPDYTGIRPKINSGGFKSDFIIEDESCDGDRKMVSLVGIESPGLTCAFSIAKYVNSMLA